jgi:hypothetical protein
MPAQGQGETGTLLAIRDRSGSHWSPPCVVPCRSCSFALCFLNGRLTDPRSGRGRPKRDFHSLGCFEWVVVYDGETLNFYRDGVRLQARRQTGRPPVSSSAARTAWVRAHSLDRASTTLGYHPAGIPSSAPCCTSSFRRSTASLRRSVASRMFFVSALFIDSLNLAIACRILLAAGLGWNRLSTDLGRSSPSISSRPICSAASCSRGHRFGERCGEC